MNSVLDSFFTWIGSYLRANEIRLENDKRSKANEEKNKKQDETIADLILRVSMLESKGKSEVEKIQIERNNALDKIEQKVKDMLQEFKDSQNKEKLDYEKAKEKLLGKAEAIEKLLTLIK